MGRLFSSLQGVQRHIARHCMDRFVPRDDGLIFVTARSAATRQSMDCSVARGDGLYAFQQWI